MYIYQTRKTTYSTPTRSGHQFCDHTRDWTDFVCSWRFSPFSAPINWLVHGHMTSNNETVSFQMPSAGNIAKTMTSNGKQFTVTREMLTAVARDGWNLCAVFKFCFCFVLLYNKSLNDWSLGEQWNLLPSNLNVSLDFVPGNNEILGKQNSLFPSGPVIKEGREGGVPNPSSQPKFGPNPSSQANFCQNPSYQI